MFYLYSITNVAMRPASPQDMRTKLRGDDWELAVYTWDVSSRAGESVMHFCLGWGRWWVPSDCPTRKEKQLYILSIYENKLEDSGWGGGEKRVPSGMADGTGERKGGVEIMFVDSSRHVL